MTLEVRDRFTILAVHDANVAYHSFKTKVEKRSRGEVLIGQAMLLEEMDVKRQT